MLKSRRGKLALVGFRVIFDWTVDLNLHGFFLLSFKALNYMISFSERWADLEYSLES